MFIKSSIFRSLFAPKFASNLGFGPLIAFGSFSAKYLPGPGFLINSGSWKNLLSALMKWAPGFLLYFFFGGLLLVSGVVYYLKVNPITKPSVARVQVKVTNDSP